jgi:hypothetical protein
MLKGLVLSLALIIAWALVQGAIFHVASPRQVFRSMLASFAPTVAIYLLLYHVTPADLGILPPGFVGVDWRLGLANGLIVLVLLFLTAGLFYSHADRSITVRLLIELARAPEQRLTLGEMQARCGVEVLMEDRLDIMVKNGFLTTHDGRLVLTAKGWVGGSVGALARRLLRVRAI